MYQLLEKYIHHLILIREFLFRLILTAVRYANKIYESYCFIRRILVRNKFMFPFYRLLKSNGIIFLKQSYFIFMIMKYNNGYGVAKE